MPQTQVLAEEQRARRARRARSPAGARSLEPIQRSDPAFWQMKFLTAQQARDCEPPNALQVAISAPRRLFRKSFGLGHKPVVLPFSRGIEFAGQNLAARLVVAASANLLLTIADS